jgi:FtsP/CotA-like multicopper oxidase with cupredoxin domain
VRKIAQHETTAWFHAHPHLDTGRQAQMGLVDLIIVDDGTGERLGLPRSYPMLSASQRGAEVRMHGVRGDAPPRMVSIDYELIVDPDETEQRLELLHTTVRKYGTVSNTVAAAARLEGSIRRKS